MRLNEKVNAARLAAIAEMECLTDAIDAMADLRRYLTSDKFSEDRTVQVADVMRRLEPLHSALCMADHNNTELRNIVRPG